MTRARGRTVRVATGDALSASVDIPARGDAARHARRTVGDLLESWHVGDLDWLYDVMLLVSELVTCTTRDGDHRLHLDLALDRSSLILGVSTPLPMVNGTGCKAHDLEQVAGRRGAEIIEAIATGWGLEPSGRSGYRVWARLPSPTL